MIDREANKPFHGLSRREKLQTAVLTTAGLCAAAAFGWFGFLYEGWLSFPGTNNAYFINHGELVKDHWIYVDGAPLLHTDAEGRRVTGLYDTGDGVYLFDANGMKMTGLQRMEDGTRYFGDDGRMLRGWVNLNGEEYFFAGDGTRSKGWLLDNDKWYWLRADGSRHEGWGRINKERYYFDPSSGEMQTGWIRDGDKWYLLSSSGNMLTGDQEKNGRLYWLGDDGSRRTGWRPVADGRRYYGGLDGHALTGWNKVDDELMYFDEAGIMQTGMIEVDGERYYLEEDGTISPGWHEIEAEDNGEPARFYVCRDGYVLDTDKETGNSGRLVIHDCGIDVALNKAVSRDAYQTITDAEDSALVVKERRDMETVIADRRSQGFTIANAVEDKTFAYIVDKNGNVTEYVCTNSSLGRNTGDDVLDQENTSVWKQNKGGFCTYTSAGKKDASAVRIVFWQPV